MSDRVLRKRRKLVAIESNEPELDKAGPSKRQRQPSSSSPPPDIFKLSVDCCDEIFEYLSLIDLHSFGRTCKTFNKVAGEYFKRNYLAKVFYVEGRGVLDSLAEPNNLSGFNDYITKGAFGANAPKYLAHHMDKLTSLKHLTLRNTDSTLKPNDGTRLILPKIEHLMFINFCAEPMDIYEVFLRLCPKLKSLYVRKLSRNENVGNESRWLHQVYPNLVKLRCIPLPPIDDLNTFFKLNQNVRCLSILFDCISKNMDELMKSTIKLDLLIVHNTRPQSSESIDLFNKLYNRGFYKRLYLSVEEIGQQFIEKLPTLQGLYKFDSSNVKEFYNLPQLVSLKRLDLKFSNVDQNEVERLANGLVNLERLSVVITNFDSILPFIRRSKNLYKIRVFVRLNGDKVLDLQMLNAERAKLVGAKKITIYIGNVNYLATKWATKNGDTNLSLIEMRRGDSFEWD